MSPKAEYEQLPPLKILKADEIRGRSLLQASESSSADASFLAAARACRERQLLKALRENADLKLSHAQQIQELRNSLFELRKWSGEEYQSNPLIDARADEVLRKYPKT